MDEACLPRVRLRAVPALESNTVIPPVLSRERLPTNTTTYQHPIHRWFNFIAGFSPEFVEECITQLGPNAGVTLLDPFAGCGTAPLVACQSGMQSIGFEPHPIFARIARAKLTPTDLPRRLEAIEHAISIGLDNPCASNIISDAASTFLLKLFPRATLESLLGAREYLRRSGLWEDDAAFLVLSKMLDQCSHSQTDGIYKAPSSRKRAQTPLEACRALIQMMQGDAAAPRSTLNRGRGMIYERSSESMLPVEDESIDVVVTSPPYLNNFDYAEMTRMYLYFWSIASTWAEITDRVRTRLIVNTTTALRGQKERQDHYRERLAVSLRPQLDSIVRELACLRTQRAGKKEYDYLVYPYFAQMTSVLRECCRCLKPGGRIHIMIADAALYGVHISTPEFLQVILGDIGFRDITCSLVRRRGHRWILAKRQGSDRGLGEYHIMASK